ncbi:MAG: DUF1961 family protein [Saprospiraceae bacterium]
MQKTIIFSLLGIISLLLIRCKTSNPIIGKTNKEEILFNKLDERDNWILAFQDKGTNDWQQNWTLDGLIATVENSEKGMNFSAGPEYKNDAHHAVLWTKPSFSGDIKIEYDYTRTDTENKCVNILYIQATGVGELPFEKDISKWKALREVPTMRKYFDNMNALHISYAAFPNTSDTSSYIRARRYPAAPNNFRESTKIDPSYDNQGYFKSGETYHITVIKTNKELFFQMEGAKSAKLFSWDLSRIQPVREGRIGLRHMYTRSAIYKNIKIHQINP